MTSSGSSEGYSIVDINEHIDAITEEKNWDLLAAFVKELMVTSWITRYMHDTRKHWTKMTGAGSQSNERLGYEVLANVTLDILKAEKAEYGEDEDYDEEEEEVAGDAPATDEVE